MLFRSGEARVNASCCGGADRELADALEDIQKIGKFIKAAANLLAKVDKLADLAKTLLPV